MLCMALYWLSRLQLFPPIDLFNNHHMGKGQLRTLQDMSGKAMTAGDMKGQVIGHNKSWRVRFY